MKVVKLLALVVVAALLYQGAQEVAASRSLRLEHFEVMGNTEDRVSTDQVVEASGVRVGDQLVAISTAEVSGRIERLPWVERARVERILPSTLRISIDEREPAFVVDAAQGRFLVDEQGLVLQQGTDQLVVLTGLPLTSLAAGTRIETPEFDHASRILEALPPELGSRVMALRAPSIDQIQFEIDGGPLIYYGAAEEIELKNHAVMTLMANAEDPAAAGGVIDVRVPSRPSTRAR